MNTQPKNKILIIIIGILLIANIATLSFFLLNKKEHPKNVRQDRKEMIRNYLEKEVHFTKEQLVQYDSLGSKHRSVVKPVFDEMSARRETIFKNLAAASFNDSAMNNAAESIAMQQKPFELVMLRHLREIRSICTAEQLPVFDTGFYKIIVKKGNGKRDNRK